MLKRQHELFQTDQDILQSKLGIIQLQSKESYSEELYELITKTFTVTPENTCDTSDLIISLVRGYFVDQVSFCYMNKLLKVIDTDDNIVKELTEYGVYHSLVDIQRLFDVLLSPSNCYIFNIFQFVHGVFSIMVGCWPVRPDKFSFNTVIYYGFYRCALEKYMRRIIRIFQLVKKHKVSGLRLPFNDSQLENMIRDKRTEIPPYLRDHDFYSNEAIRYLFEFEGPMIEVWTGCNNRALLGKNNTRDVSRVILLWEDYVQQIKCKNNLIFYMKRNRNDQNYIERDIEKYERKTGVFDAKYRVCFAREELNEARKKYDAAKIQLQASIIQLNNVRTELNVVRMELNSTRMELNSAMTESNNVNTELNNAKSRLTMTDDRLTSAEEKLLNKEKELTSVVLELSTVKEQMKEQLKVLMDKDQELQDLKSRMSTPTEGDGEVDSSGTGDEYEEDENEDEDEYEDDEDEDDEDDLKPRSYPISKYRSRSSSCSSSCSSTSSSSSSHNRRSIPRNKGRKRSDESLRRGIVKKVPVDRSSVSRFVYDVKSGRFKLNKDFIHEQPRKKLKYIKTSDLYDEYVRYCQEKEEEDDDVVKYASFSKNMTIEDCFPSGCGIKVGGRLLYCRLIGDTLP